MSKLDEIRGKKETKTESIVDFFASHPGKIFTPSQVAQELGIDQSTTVTILNRLTSEGVLAKEGRGEYCFQWGIDSEKAERIYRQLYKTLGNAIGFQIARNILQMDEDHTENADAREVLTEMVSNLNDTFGLNTTRNMLYVTVKAEFGEHEFRQILQELNPGEKSGV